MRRPCLPRLFRTCGAFPIICTIFIVVPGEHISGAVHRLAAHYVSNEAGVMATLCVCLQGLQSRGRNRTGKGEILLFVEDLREKGENCTLHTSNGGRVGGPGRGAR